jgi:hypothetical protein
MDVMTGSEEKCRYGLVWKTNNKAGIYKNINLKRERNKCVLLTNKSANVLNDLLSIMLKIYNYEVVITYDEEKALKAFRKKRYDLLLSIVPGIVGVVLGKIKAFAPETEVLIVSGLNLSSLSRPKIAEVKV